jgi:FMN reductase
LVKLGVVVGNPKPRSRTLEAAVLVAKRLTGFQPGPVIDIVELGAGLLEFGHERVVESISAIQQVDVLLVASPTYKATYTGVLKLYLDQIPANGLSEIVALPMMLGAGPSHAMAP